MQKIDYCKNKKGKEKRDIVYYNIIILVETSRNNMERTEKFCDVKRWDKIYRKKEK